MLALGASGAVGCSSDQQGSSSSSTTSTVPMAVTSTLEFRPVLAMLPPDATVGPDVAAGNGMNFEVGTPTQVAVVGASASKTPSGSDLWDVRLQLAPGAEGIDAFNEAARTCHAMDATCPTGQLAVMLDGRVLSAPRIEPDQRTFTPFVADQISVSGPFDQAAAEALATRLNGG